jgi:hypothetical protein
MSLKENRTLNSIFIVKKISKGCFDLNLVSVHKEATVRQMPTCATS